MFDNSHRPKELVLPACKECNGLGRTADLVASIISRWAYELTPAEQKDHARLAARLRTQAPKIVEEITSLRPEERAKAIQSLQAQGVHVPDPSGVASIGPLTVMQINLFAHRVALALYFAIFGEMLGSGGLVWATWRTKEDIQVGGLPSTILQMMPKSDFLKQGGWSTQDTFEYRYDWNKDQKLLGFVARFRRAFFVVGFAVGADSRGHFAAEDDWISPSDLDRILTDPRYEKRY